MSRRAALVAMIVITTLGAFLRLANLHARPFWRDEAWVATLVRDSSIAELVRQHEFPIPPGFAILAKLSWMCVAPAEIGLRLPAVLAGIAVPPLLYLAARRLRASRSLAVCAALLAAVSVSLVVWSRELKQYEIEALAATLGACLIAGVRHAGDRRRRARSGMLLVATCVLAPPCGYGAAIALGSLASMLIVLRPRFGSRRESLRWGALALAALLASSGIVWWTAARAQADSPALQAYMSNFYIDPTSVRDWARAAMRAGITLACSGLSIPLIAEPRDEVQTLISMGATAAGGVLVCIGIAGWPRRARMDVLWWFAAPLAATLLLAMFRAYPLGQMRMLQYWIPGVVLLLAAGVIGAVRGLRWLAGRRGGRAWPVAALVICLAPIWFSLQETLYFRQFVYHDFPTVVRVLEEQRRPYDVVIVDTTAAPCVEFYAPHLYAAAIKPDLASGTLPRPGADFVASVRRELPHIAPRGWLVCTDEPANPDRAALLQFFAESGLRVESVVRVGVESGSAHAAELLRIDARP